MVFCRNNRNTGSLDAEEIPGDSDELFIYVYRAETIIWTSHMVRTKKEFYQFACNDSTMFPLLSSCPARTYSLRP